MKTNGQRRIWRVCTAILMGVIGLALILHFTGRLSLELFTVIIHCSLPLMAGAVYLERVSSRPKMAKPPRIKGQLMVQWLRSLKGAGLLKKWWLWSALLILTSYMALKHNLNRLFCVAAYTLFMYVSVVVIKFLDRLQREALLRQHWPPDQPVAPWIIISQFYSECGAAAYDTEEECRCALHGSLSGGYGRILDIYYNGVPLSRKERKQLMQRPPPLSKSTLPPRLC
jgi:hypothetical protein